MNGLDLMKARRLGPYNNNCYRIPIHSLEKLELIFGKPDCEEIICGLKFYISPFSLLKMNPRSRESICNSVIELADSTSDCVVLDACAGYCDIAFAFANVSYHFLERLIF